jgi:hypothetical protein
LNFLLDDPLNLFLRKFLVLFAFFGALWTKINAGVLVEIIVIGVSKAITCLPIVMDLRGIVGEASILDPSCEDCFHFGG